MQGLCPAHQRVSADNWKFERGYFIDFLVAIIRNDGQLFNGSVYQKVDSNLDTGIQVSWAAGSQNTTFGIGCKYSLDKDASLRAKVNNSFQIGLGYQQKLRDGNFCVLVIF